MSSGFWLWIPLVFCLHHSSLYQSFGFIIHPAKCSHYCDPLCTRQPEWYFKNINEMIFPCLKTGFFNSSHCPWNEIQTLALVYAALLANLSGLIFWYCLPLTVLQLHRSPLWVLSSLRAFALADPVPGLPSWILSGGQLLCNLLASAKTLPCPLLKCTSYNLSPHPTFPPQCLLPA